MRRDHRVCEGCQSVSRDAGHDPSDDGPSLLCRMYIARLFGSDDDLVAASLSDAPERDLRDWDGARAPSDCPRLGELETVEKLREL